jgi:tight adherence protein B
VAAIVLVLLLGGLLTVLRPRPTRSLEQRLTPYVSAPSTERASGPQSVSILRHVGHSTERALGELKFWKGIARLIERADMPLRTAELFYVMVGAALGVGVIVTLAGLTPIMALPVVLVAGALPLLVVSRRARKRQRAFDDQLPDVLMTMASSMRAGHSFNQAMDVIIHEGGNPASGEFGRAATEIRLGRAADAALDRMAQRLDSKNFGFVVTAVNIQRQVGGSMAEILDSVADTVRGRQQFLRKVKGLTAMGRGSAYVLVAMPFVLAAVMTLIAREFMLPLFVTTVGQMMVAGALCSIVIGSLMLKKIVGFKV